MARTGLYTVSLSSGRYAFETYEGGKRAIRGPGGTFVAGGTLDLPEAEIAMIFQLVRSKVETAAMQGASKVIEGTVVNTKNIKLSILGLRNAVYDIKKLEALLTVLPQYEIKLQEELRIFVTRGLQRFVNMVVIPKAEEIIDTLVYAPSLANTAERIRRQMAGRRSAKHGADEFTREGTKLNKVRLQYVNALDEKSRNDPFSYARALRRGEEAAYKYLEDKFSGESARSAKFEFGIGSGAATWGERRGLQFAHSMGTRVGMIESRSGSLLSMRSVSLTGRSGGFMYYAGATGTLRAAFRNGIFAIGSAIHIGIDERAFPFKPYWQFVEFGHGYRVPRKTESGYEMVTLPFAEPAKPFLRTLNQWMATEGKARLDTEIQNGFKRFNKRVDDGIRSIIAARV